MKLMLNEYNNHAQAQNRLTFRSKRINGENRERNMIYYRGTVKQFKAYFSSETMEIRRQWNNIFKVKKGK